MIVRSAVLIALFAAAFTVRASLNAPRVITTAETLSQFPSTLGQWRGTDYPLEPDVIKMAAVNDYLNRQYQGSNAGPGVGLYVGYYQSQRQGEALHSPLFCLPGTGWQPVKNERLELSLGGAQARTVNALVVERGLDRLLVLYWYQTVERVIASEYARKLFLMHDALFSGRTDVALVRIITTIRSRDVSGEASAIAAARPFAEQVLPELQHRLFKP